MLRLGVIVASCALACTPVPPKGFSGGAGDRWTFPLVGALEDGLLITPVLINSTGPYLFAIDPDAPVSAIDGEIVKRAELRTFLGPDRVDETDAAQGRPYAEVVNLEIGSLIIERREVFVVKSGSFDAMGRRIHGVIGRDVIAESTVFGFDREHGLGYVVTVGAFRPPPDSIEITYTELAAVPRKHKAMPPPRRLAQATVNGQPMRLHLDLGAVASQLRAPLWETAQLDAREVQAVAVDEVGTSRRVTHAAEQVPVTLGTATNASVAFVPYGDRRWPDEVAGTLGLGFFARYDAWLAFDAKALYLRPRKDLPYKLRAARWETGALQNCQAEGCITARLVDPLNGQPPEDGRAHPGVVLSITREERAGGMGLEVMLEAVGKPQLPRLIVNLPPHLDRLIDQLPPEFLGATLIVRDASPYPRQCPGKQGCVDKIAR